MKKVTLKIEGMKCSGCSDRLERILNSKNDIIKAEVNLEKKEAIIEYENITEKELKEYVEEAGFKAI